MARLTLNRPDKLNVTGLSSDGGIIDDFSVALDKAERGDDLKILIIKGGAPSITGIQIVKHPPHFLVQAMPV